MSKQATKRKFLIQAVLASTIFVNPQVYATKITGGVTTPGPLNTSTYPDNIIEVPGGAATAGQIISTNNNAVNLNTGNGQVIVDANNTIGGPQAIYATGVGAKSIAINITGNNGIVTVQGAGSGITSDNTSAGSDTIYVDAPNVMLNNAGIIDIGASGKNSYSAIHITKNGANTTLNNQLGGTIQNTNGSLAQAATILVDSSTTGLIINNTGTITEQALAGNNQNTILNNSGFTAINNLANGLIQQISGGIDTGNTILVNAPGINNITNNLNAKIVNLGKGNAILIDAASTGNIINGGEITANDASAILLNAGVNSIVNTGQIENHPITTPSTTATIATGTNNVILPDGLTNTGNIINLAPGGLAIDFQTKATQAALFQNNGSINGTVLLASKDGSGRINVFTMMGGQIGGDVKAANVQSNNLLVQGGTITGNLVGGAGVKNTFTLSGGTISGGVTLGNAGDTVNLSGTNTNAILGGSGNDTFNVSGGNLFLLNGNGGSDTLNVTGTFTANGPIQKVPAIHIQNPGTVFTANDTITNLDNSLTIDPNTTFVPNNYVNGKGVIVNNGTLLVTNIPLINSPLIDLSSSSGFTTNNGTVKIQPTAILTFYGNAANTVFNGTKGSNINIQIAGLAQPGDAASAGQIEVYSPLANALVLNQGTTISPTFTDFVPQGKAFDIITVKGKGTFTDNSALIQPASAVVSFLKTPINNNTILQLTANRTPYSAISNTQVTQGVAASLDTLAQGNGPANGDLLNLLSQLDQLALPAQVDQAIQSLAPFFNYGLIAASFGNMNSVFDGLHLRIEELRYLNRQTQSGKNYGDLFNGLGGWGKVLGGYLDQDARDNVAGFKVKGAGVALGGDWSLNDCSTLGIAGSFVKSSLDDKNVTPKDAHIESWQGSAYGWFEFAHGIYLDTMLAYAHNDYDTNRLIQVNQITTAAQASFHGSQWGALADLGIVLPFEDYYFSPFARVKYLHLSLEGYTETDTNALNLSVTQPSLEDFMGGLGVKLGKIFYLRKMFWVPEISALMGSDFKMTAEQPFANFLGGGPAFTTKGLRLSQNFLDLGLGLDVHYNQQNVFTLKYNLELRSGFINHAGYVQYYIRWG